MAAWIMWGGKGTGQIGDQETDSDKERCCWVVLDGLS